MTPAEQPATMLTDEARLLPCPFCGGTRISVEHGVLGRCRDCFARGPWNGDGSPTVDEKSAAWNRRADDRASLARRNHDLTDEVNELLTRVRELEGALRRIERWFGEFPPTGKFWQDDPNRPMSYAACFGSNGERDYMRKIARDALQGSSPLPPAPAQEAR